MRNPEIFDIAATIILAELYENFPVRIDISIENIYYNITDKFPDAEFELCQQIYDVIESSIKWLERFGYIEVGEYFESKANRTVLTEKGLCALRSIPKSIDVERETVGDILAQAGKEGTREAVLRGVGALFGGIFSVAL